MKRILSTLTLLLCFAFTAVNAQGAYDQATMGAKVVEMETASWGQNSPFNNYCWSEYGGSTHAKAGCVPVAFAIVMRYHGFPAEGTSNTLYNCQASTYVEITDRTYDWEKMPLTNSSGWTTEQQHEVAKLISHLGHAFGVSYGVSQTSVSIGDSQTERLTKYFNYKAASATSQYPSNNNLESWKQKIKESLNNGCPVPYAANNTGTGDSRHMFVIDGYTSNDYFHFNFGWNGSGNGWFKLDNITPAQGDNYSWSDASDGYTSKHQAFFNLMPNKTPRTVTATTNSSSMGTVSINGGTAGNSVSAEVTEGTKATLTAHPADGYALASWTKNGVVVGTKNPIQVSVGESGNDYVANFDDEANVLVEKDCTFNISAVSTSGVSGSYCSTWTTSDGIVLSCTKGAEPAYALSTTVNTFFAKATVGNSETLVTDITYTLTAPEGYVIKSYSFKGKSPSSSYTIDVTVGGNTTNVTNASAGVVISASDINAQSTSFVLSSTYAGLPGLSIMEDGVTVTIVSEGGNVGGEGGGSTPAPDPDPEPEPTPELVVPTGAVKYGVTFDGATWTRYNGDPIGTNSWIFRVVTNTTPAVTVQVDGDVNNLGFQTINQVKHPYLYRGTNFTITVPESYKIAGYKLTVKGDNFVNGTYTYTTGATTNGTGTITQNGVEQTVIANGLDTRIINVNVGSGSGTAGIIITALEIVYIKEEVEEPGDSTDPLAGKWFRLKEKTAGTYMNIYDNDTHGSGAKGGVNVATLNEDTDGQIFQFIEGDNGYKLQSKTGYYINCQAWNVDANSTTIGAVLTLESTENEYEYLIKCSNGYFKIGAVDGNANIGKFVYCNESAKANASTWVLEEVVEGEEPEQPQELFPDGIYKIYWEQNNRGYLAYHETNSPSKAVLADVTYTGCANIHYNSSSDPVNLNWYLITADDGKRYLFQATTGKFLGYESGTTNNKLNLTEALPIAIEENIKHSGYYIITSTINNNSRVLLCSACGTETKNNGNGVRWLDVTDSNQQDGGAPLKFVPVSDVTVAESVMNTVLRVINGNNAVPFKVEIEGLRENDPNTHFATITVGGTAVKLAPAHLTQSEIEATLVAGSTLAINHKYRGFEFNGFYIGTTSLGESATLTDEQIAAISATTPLVAKFTATNTGEATLFSAEDEFSYRIPAIVKTVKDDKHKLIAISDYRHSFDDIGRDNHNTGTTQVDLVIRTSEDNGATWTAKQTIAEGSQHFGYGDAAAVANGQDVLVMAVAGNVFYAYADSNSPQQAYRIYSNDNGVTWEKEDISSNMESLFPDYHGLFFGSGKLAVDPDFNGSGNARVYGAILMKDSQGERNYVLYSDNWGKTWSILGNAVAARQNEPKVEILPNGQILLSARRGSGRTFNVFTYTDKANNAGTWSTATNGCDNGGNSTNGEIICLDAKKPNGKPTKILLQSQPYGSDRRNVSIWYKEIGANETYTASSIASEWTMGKQVSTQLSAYSAMCLQENGEIALFFEEAPCYGDDHTKGYSMVYVPLTIEEITGENFLNPNADVEYVPVEFNIELTDAEGNIYRETLDYVPDNVAAALTAKYPFITLGENGVVADNKYTNTVTLPFKVSNAETTAWYNIYWPANTNENHYPVYLSAASATDTYVPKVTESKAYGESTYNTLQNGDKISWAIYSVDNTLTFKFKNKLTGKYIQATSVATGNAQNVVYANENNATAFELLPDSYSYAGDYALKANVNGTDGYLCSTSATGYNYATHYNGNGHQGAWFKFDEAPDYQAIVDALTENVDKFGAGNGNYTDNNDIDAIKTIIENIANTPLNTLNTHTETVQTVKESYREVVLTVNEVETETATVPGSVSITVNGSEAEPVNNKFVPANATVSILATANPGFRFVNWTRPAAPQASAAARTAEARNSNVVSSDNPYTVTVSEALSLEANFEQIVVDVTLTDAQSNTYEVQVSGFTTEVTKDAVADKLRAAYPYITLGTTDANGNVIDNGDLNINGTAYTYTNNVELPFKVSNAAYIWHNIYWPSNTRAYDYPIYWAASSAEDTYVPKVTGSYAYGAHPTYNTKDGNDKISWAIYNVNNSFEFIFKNKVTNKYIKVTSVANGDAQNVVYVENAEDATAFTIEKKPAGNDYYTPAQYALAANVGETKGYLCSTSAGYNYATHHNSNAHQGAWIEFVEAPDYSTKIMDLEIVLGMKFGAGDGKCVIAGTEIEAINTAMQNSGTITLNNLTEYAATMENAMNNNNAWHNVALTVAPEETGTAIIQLANDDPALTSKRVPTNYELKVVATPAEGYHFVNWTNGDNAIEGAGAEYTFEVTTATTLTANFEKNTYTISVLAGEGGSAYIVAPGTTEATVEHGNEVTLTAVANDGYRFVNWTKGTDVVSTEPNYTFAATADGEYVANFQLAGTPVTYYTVNIVTEGISNDKFAAYINTGTTQNETQKSYREGSTVSLIAVPDNATVGSTGYAFDGWYLGDTRISTSEEIEFEITSDVEYKAKFVEGIRVSVRAERGWPHIYLLDSNKEVGGTSSSTLIAPGRGLKLSVDAEFGCRFVRWTVNGVEQSTENPFIVENLTESVTYMAICEPAYYTLTVSSNPATAGTVSATSGAATGTSIMVGHNMTATITATPANGYKFVNWTKGIDVVSTNATYEVPAIDDVNAMVNTEYVANFVESDEPEAPANVGTYYRIGYDGFDAPAAAPATRAATRAVVTYSITPASGTATVDNGKTSLWSFTTNGEYPAGLTLNATHTHDIEVDNKTQTKTTSIKAISVGNQYIDLCAGGWTDDGLQTSNATFTLSVQNSEYKIVGYSITCQAASSSYNLQIIPQGRAPYDVSKSSFETLSVDGLNDSETTFELNDNDGISGKTMYIDSFEVYIQEVGSGEGGEVGGGETPETPDTPETPSNRYYVQSVASGVANKSNALLMTQETGASSIFYYAGSKLMSYDKGTYIKEDGNTRGLQAIGTSGAVTITTAGETSKIQVPSYMHANSIISGTNTTYFIDHCSGDSNDHATAHSFILEEVDSLPVTISAVGYASWYAPVAVQLPANVNAWYLTEDGVEDGYVSMEEIGVGGVVPAFTGVILEGLKGTHNLAITTADSGIAGNLLTGTVAATYITNDAYVLSKPSDNELGLYLVKFNQQSGNAWKNNSHKAYLPRTAVSPAMQMSAGFRFRFSGGVTTAVEKVEMRNEKEEIYDLTGRKLEGISGTGIYIVNGKKVLIK